MNLLVNDFADQGNPLSVYFVSTASADFSRRISL